MNTIFTKFFPIFPDSHFNAISFTKAVMNIIFTTFFPFAPRTRQSPTTNVSFFAISALAERKPPQRMVFGGIFNKKDIGSLFSILSDSSISLSKLCFFHGLNHFLGNQVPACDADRRASFFNVA